LEDQYQFILPHRIMWKETDDKVAVTIIDEAKQRFQESRNAVLIKVIIQKITSQN